MQQAIRKKKKTRKMPKISLQSSTYHNLDEGGIGNGQLGNPHSPGLALSDFHLFGPVKVH
jgi:hypothetical protein